MDLEKIEAIMNWQTPRNVTDVRSFMGLAEYYKRFIEGFSNESNYKKIKVSKTLK